MLREPAQPIFVFDEAQVKMYFADEPETAIEHLERSRRDDERAPPCSPGWSIICAAREKARCASPWSSSAESTNAKARLLAAVRSTEASGTNPAARGSAPSGQPRTIGRQVNRIGTLRRTAMDAKYAIDLEHVTRLYKRDEFEVRALDDVTVQIPAERFVAIMGPSGSGKTTMLNLIAGIDHATTGRVAVGGEEIAGMKERELAGWRARHIGLVFQFYNLIPVLTAFENVELPLLLTSLSKAERREHVETALRVVGLADRMDHYPRQLSGGQEQRVAIARAIVDRPDDHRRRRADRRPRRKVGRGNPEPAGRYSTASSTRRS